VKIEEGEVEDKVRSRVVAVARFPSLLPLPESGRENRRG